jgi:wyosine [tRNA(Phe)-imidazoG37] synthetase (radical SAM superfamily)
MPHVFGPVPSRRLGQSLGIDTIPLKTCNWNCVYCQLGRSKPLTNQRKDYIPLGEIISDVDRALISNPPEEVDWITFVGAGEPTLHAGIGWLIKEVKKRTEIPVAVITNGSLLFLKSMRRALMAADAILPSLDAGTATLYKKINRPHPDIPFSRYLKGLIEFRKEYKGQLWVEVMLIRDLNDTTEALQDIATAVEKIQPDKVHIGMPTRPPVEKWVKPPDSEGIMRASSILGEVAQVIHPREGFFDLSGSQNHVETIIGIITRHPMSEDQLFRAIEFLPNEKRDQIIDSLKTTSKVQIIERLGKRFWCATPSVFPDTEKQYKPSFSKSTKE